MRNLAHPPCSACLNPLENLWGKLKYGLPRLNPRPTTSQGALWSGSARVDGTGSGPYIDRLVLSMSNRMKAVLSAQGGHIKY